MRSNVFLSGSLAMRLSVVCVMASILFIVPVASQAAGYTTNAARVLASQAVGGAFYVIMDAPANNVNGCASFSVGMYGVTGGYFGVMFPGGALTDSQRAMITSIQAAQTSGKLIGIYSAGCASGVNTIDQVVVRTD